MEAVLMRNLTTAKQEQPNPDQSIIAFQLIHTLYCSKLLNTATYDNIKKQFGPAITEGQLSSDFLNRFRLELKSKPVGQRKSCLTCRVTFLKLKMENYPQRMSVKFLKSVVPHIIGGIVNG